MKSNYVKSAHAKISKHPEWDRKRQYEEIKKACEKANTACYMTGNGNIFIVLNSFDKPIKIIYEGE